MGRHIRARDTRLRALRGGALTLIWIGGLAVGFFAVLSVAARYSCGRSAHGLGCHTSGSALGLAIVLAVVAVVTAVTVSTHDQGARRLVVATLLGAVGLGACYVAAHALIATT